MEEVILLGSGSSRDRRLLVGGRYNFEGQHITTLDIEPSHGTDIVWDLEKLPWPFADDSADEIHAYELLEHLGHLGNAEEFFAHFNEIWRILKPGGHLAATCPAWNSRWAFGDPGHRRVISRESLVYLQRPEYKKQVGITAMTDYRSIYIGDFDVMASQETEDTHAFVLKAIKPVRS